MYYINEVFLRSIHRIWGMTQREFSMAALGSSQQLDKRMAMFENILVTDIIKIANYTHIPIRYFFVETPKGKLYDRTKVEKKNNWHDIEVNIPGIQNIYTGQGYNYDRNEMLKSAGIKVTGFWRWLQPGANFNMRAYALCSICNTYGIDLQDAITDPNDTIPEATQSEADTSLQSANARLERRMKAQEQKLDSLAKDIKQVIKERDTAVEEAIKLRSKNRYATDTTETIMLVSECEHPRWRWQPSRWDDTDIPTLAQLIFHCNKHHCPTLPFLSLSDGHTPLHKLPTESKEVTQEPTFQTITIDYMAYTMLAKSLGITETPDQLLIPKFCTIIDANGLTPASCIRDKNSNYPTTFPDRMVRALGSAGITA